MIDLVRQLIRRLGFYLRRDQYEAEFSEEIAFHVAMRAAEHRQSGLPEPDAARQARRRFGNSSVIREAARDVWAVRWWESLRRDLGLALRGLRRAPGFTATTLVTIALGIGGTTTIFSFVYAALLAPLPYPDPDRLVNLHVLAREEGGEPVPFPWSYPKFVLMRSLARTVNQIAGFNATNVNLRGGDGPERVVLEEVSAEYLPLLGARAAIGRLFSRGEDSIPNGNPVVVLSHQLWRQRFGQDTAVIGRAISIGGVPFMVIGVLAPGFRSLSGPVDLWTPLAMIPTLEYPEVMEESGSHWMGVVARLKPGVTAAAAAEEMAVVGGRVDERYRSVHQTRPWSATATPVAEVRVEPTIRRATLVLFGAVGLVLLIASANVASLLLVRSVGRGRELAIRAAVGAGRGALVRQLLVESLVITGIGGALGVGLARVGASALVSLSPASRVAPGGIAYLFDLEQVGQGRAVLGFAVVVTLVTGLLVGLLPARRAAATSLVGGLKASRGWGGGGGHRRFGALHGLIAGEAALAVILVVGAGLMVRSFVRLAGIDVGFVGDRVLTFRIAPSDQDLAAREPAKFKGMAIAALAALPGVEAVGVNTCAPLTGLCNGSVVGEGRDGRGGSPIGVHYVNEGYFTALKIPLVAGRLFDRGDRPGTGRVAILNAAAAARLWPGETALGKQLSVAAGYFFGGDSSATVVGVVGDVRYGSVEEPPDLDAYVPALQSSYGRGLFFLRTKGDPVALTEAARASIRSLDPGLPIFAVITMESLSAQSTARSRFLTLLLGAFSAVAVLLAAVGIYGVVAFAVSGRAREISIRLAVGAEPKRVVALMTRQGVVPVAVGVAVGLAAAVGLTRLMTGLLYDVRPSDGPSLVSAIATLGAVGLVASWVPARRAARVAPVEALKGDT